MIDNLELDQLESEPGRAVLRTKSPVGYERTVQTIGQLIEAKGLQLYAYIDYQHQAKLIGKSCQPMSLFLFGEAEIDVPLLMNNHGIGLELPHSFFVSEDEQGHVWLLYRDFEMLSGAYEFGDADELITGVIGLIQNIVSDLAAAENDQAMH